MATRPGSIQSPADFDYDNLSGSKSKRLLKVLPTRANDMVQLQLWEEPTAVPYRCLSYTRGAPIPTFAIQVNGHTMQVGRNLHEFLTVAAKRFANEILWKMPSVSTKETMPRRPFRFKRWGTHSKRPLKCWCGSEKMRALRGSLITLSCHRLGSIGPVTTCQFKGSRGPCENRQSD